MNSKLRAAVFGFCCVALGACASTSEIQAERTQKDMFATVQDFSVIAQERGWSGNPGPGAVSLLLNGSAQNAPTPAEAYLNGKGAADMETLAIAVVDDLHIAADKTEYLAAIAEACVNGGNPAAARANLNAVERAVILAKRVRTTLASAVDRLRMVMTPADAASAQSRLARLESQIHRLDSAADSIAQTQRKI